ncbi:MAG: RloB domain-containing protein [Lachnospiraceae bacterium]|nr:RloB domain-containing protein [Lachnospiraceae bacterium]
MREKRTFAERTQLFTSDKTLRKYFLVYEGDETEAIYFDAVSSMREEIKISPLIEIIPIIKSYSEDGWSNPKKILNRMIENLEENRTNQISYETLLNRIMDYFYEAKVITTSKVQAKSIWKAMCRICEEKCLEYMDAFVDDIEKSCSLILKSLQEEYNLPHIITDISMCLKNVKKWDLGYMLRIHVLNFGCYCILMEYLT